MNTLIQEIISWIHNSDKKLIIGISGHGAAGKTTFAHMLMEELKNDVRKQFMLRKIRLILS